VQLTESSAARFWRVEFDELTPAEQVLLAVWELETEVNSGGFVRWTPSVGQKWALDKLGWRPARPLLQVWRGRSG
jgi:hypothetical protein